MPCSREPRSHTTLGYRLIADEGSGARPSEHRGHGRLSVRPAPDKWLREHEGAKCGREVDRVLWRYWRPRRPRKRRALSFAARYGSDRLGVLGAAEPEAYGRTGAGDQAWPYPGRETATKRVPRHLADTVREARAQFDADDITTHTEGSTTSTTSVLSARARRWYPPQPPATSPAELFRRPCPGSREASAADKGRPAWAQKALRGAAAAPDTTRLWKETASQI